MTIASEITNYANGLGDAYDAVNDMGGVIPQDKNMNNLDTSIRTIPQNLGPTYVAGNGIDITNDTISIDDTVVAELSDLPTKTSDLQNDGSDGTSTYVEADDLATVATSGLYSDLTGTPTIPTVNDATLTITQNGVSAGTFTANSSSDTTIALTDTTYSDFGGATSSVAGSAGLVPAPTTSDPDKFLKGDGTWGTPTDTTYSAGTNVQISAGNVISATDTTYSAFTGATSGAAGTAGLVPAPAAGDQGKVLKGDGSWETINDCTTFYVDGEITANGIYSLAIEGYRQYTLYKDDALTVAATALEFWDAFEKGSVRICALLSLDGYYDDYVVTARICNDSETDEAYYQIGSPYGYDAGGIRFTIAVDTTLNTVYFTKRQYVQIMSGASASSNGAVGVVPAPAAGDQDKVLHGDGTWKDTTAKLVEMSYGEANAWTKFINAYNAGSIVYCRASSNANPASGAQTRKAFMAYVNNETNPTSVEFQYVRSVSSKTDSQQCDQVFVYTLTNTGGGTWSVASRNMAPKVAVDSSLTKTFTTGANATVTLKANNMTGATSSADGAAGYVTKPLIADRDKVLKGDGTWDTRAKITMTSTDPGSGSALAADNYVAVYGNSDGQITSTDLANNSVATANLQDYSVTRVKLNHLDLVNNGEWVCVGYAYLGATTDSTVAVTVDIPADYQGQKMQYKVVGAYECPSVNGSTKYTRVEVKIGGVWKTSNVFNSYQGVVTSNWVWYGGSGSAGYAGTAAWFGHEWTTASDWDSCTFEFVTSSCYPGSHWAFSGTAGGMSGGHPGTLNYGGRVQDGNAIQAFRLACSASVKWGQGAGLAVYARRKNF